MFTLKLHSTNGARKFSAQTVKKHSAGKQAGFSTTGISTVLYKSFERVFRIFMFIKKRRLYSITKS